MKIASTIKRNLILGLVAITVGLASFTATAQTYVNGYFKSNGTYVQGHYRSSPDSSYNNNWSVSPNVNPYTGTKGTRQPTLNDTNPYSGTNGARTWYGTNSYSGNSINRKSLW